MRSVIGAYFYFLHGIHHYRWLDVRLQSWLLGALVALGLAGWLVFGRAVGLVFLALVVALVLSRRWAEHGFYLHFRAADHPPPPDPAPIWPPDKILLHASGLFGAEDRQRACTCLPAFYRTFETREHVLMARRTPAAFFGIAQWPEEDFGMWYIFVRPEMLKSVRRGHIFHGAQPRPGLRVDYVRRNQKGKEVRERLYLAFANEADRGRVQADLLLDLGGPARSPWRQDNSQR